MVDDMAVMVDDVAVSNTWCLNTKTHTALAFSRQDTKVRDEKPGLSSRAKTLFWDAANEDKDAQCTICGTILKYNNSTTSLNYHLNSQPTIASVLGRRVCDSIKAEGITQRICNMVTTDMLPINVVHGQGF